MHARFQFVRLSAALCLCLISAAGGAQDAIVFHPARDLERFEETTFSPYSELFPLEEFEKLEGSTVSREELARLRERWKTEFERVGTRIAAIERDPREKHWYVQRKELARSSFFSKLDLFEARVGGDILLLIEQPKREVAGWNDKVAIAYGPWLRKIGEVFSERYAKPLGLARRAEVPADIVCILADEESYREYTRQSSWPATEIGPAFWDARLKLVVGYEDPFTAEVAPVWQRYPVLREHVRALESAHYSGPGERQASLWLNEGVASYLAWHEGEVPDCLGQRAVNRETLAVVVAALQDKQRRAFLLHPVAELIELPSVKAVLEVAARRAESRKAAQPDWRDVLRIYYGESALWMHFLQDGQNGRYRAGFEKYLRSAFAGTGGVDAFWTHVKVASADDLEREFHEYLFQLHEREFPDFALDRSVLTGLAAERRAGSADAADAEPEPEPAGPIVPLPSPTFSPAELAIDAGDHEAHHAIAAAEARRGDLAAATARLEGLVAKKPAGAPDVNGERILRELERVRQLTRLRDGYFEHLRESHEKWVTQWGGRPLSTGIARIEGGWLYLSENKLGLSKIELAKIDPYEIARQAGQPAEQGGAEPWTRAYAYLLHGDPKWDKLLKDDPGSRALRDDAKDWYPGLLRTAEAALALESLSKVRLPQTSKEAKAITDQLRTLLAAGTDLPLLRRKLEPARQLAIHAIAKTFVEQDPKDLAHGTWSALGNGRVVVAYDFVRPEEAQDFSKELGVLKEWRRKLPAVSRAEAESNWSVENGEFVGTGAACYRYFVGVSAPLVLRWDLRCSPGDVEATVPTQVRISVCDEGPERTITCMNHGDLTVVDKGFVKELRGTQGAPFEYEQVYHFEIRHDGTTVSTWIDGEKKFEAPAGPRQSGGITLWFHTDVRIAIEKLEIEGKVDPTSLDRLKAETFQRRLTELGFP